MAMSSGVRKLLICLICVFGVLLIVLCIAATVVVPQLEATVSTTYNSSHASLSKPTTLPGTSTVSTILGTTTRPTIPTTLPVFPTTVPSVPTTFPMIPTTQPTVPVTPTTKPTFPVAPTTKPAPPTTQPTQPTTQPTQPTTQPTQPTTQPTQPTTQPTQPTTQPTQPTTRPTQPTTQPTQPTTQPTQPTTQPTQPTTRPTQPTKPPFDEAKFYSESVFLGDSLTVGLSGYCMTYKDALPGARFLCAASYAVRHAIDEVGGKYVVSISYQGTKMRPEDALAAMGAKRVFIMLGLNDIGLGINWTMKNYDTLIKNIRSKCPNIEIYIQSGTPVYFGSENNGLTNPNMDKYNLLLEQYCKENGCYFINVAQVLKNSEGGLKKEYTSDKYVHLNYTGMKAWVDYLKAYIIEKHK